MQCARPFHGLALRLALSCLVDADHSDTAFFDSGALPPRANEPRWSERLAALRRYVEGFGSGETEAERVRNQQRSAFFESCLNSPIDDPLVACEAPVGLGKTTSVTAYLLRRARDENLRRLIIIAPYTNILTQTANVLRKALVLPGERPSRVVVEHHHRADFEDPADRDLAVLWNAPIVVTTAVNFFETLAANDPASLRKFHAVPGSAIFMDEAHAALPSRLLPQNWRWMCELAYNWKCRFVFASGSLARYWEDRRIVPRKVNVPELLPIDQSATIRNAENRRILFRSASHDVVDVQTLLKLICASPSPRLAILSTVQNAAVVARTMRNAGLDVLHLSTALSPRDRERVYKRIKARLLRQETDWSLVATSCVEAGVDFSFRSGFRERFSVASLLQTAGRVNRNSEYNAQGGSVVYDFALSDLNISQHPAAKVTAGIVREFFDSGAIHRDTSTELVTRAMRTEIDRLGGVLPDNLSKAEEANDYPQVKEQGKVIDADTRLVIVDRRLRKRLIEGKRVGFRMLLQGSVQIWTSKLSGFRLEPLHLKSQKGEIYFWENEYEPDFLGYMAGVLKCNEFLANGGAVI